MGTGFFYQSIEEIVAFSKQKSSMPFSLFNDEKNFVPIITNQVFYLISLAMVYLI